VSAKTSKCKGTHTGRRPGAGGTREAILQSARQLFTERGYDATSIRAVAEESGVDPALVIHYFSSKEGLFRESIDLRLDIGKIADAIFGSGFENAGGNLIREVCAVWEDESRRHPLAVLIRNAIEHDEAARMLSDFIDREIVSQLTARSDSPDARLSGSLAYSQLLGMVLVRYVIRLEPLASLTVDEVTDLLGPVIQAHLAGQPRPHSETGPKRPPVGIA
jgi:AcrR family transcriptional regulator